MGETVRGFSPASVMGLGSVGLLSPTRRARAMGVFDFQYSRGRVVFVPKHR